jgi:hypothetical protein
VKTPPHLRQIAQLLSECFAQMLENRRVAERTTQHASFAARRRLDSRALVEGRRRQLRRSGSGEEQDEEEVGEDDEESEEEEGHDGGERLGQRRTRFDELSRPKKERQYSYQCAAAVMCVWLANDGDRSAVTVGPEFAGLWTLDPALSHGVATVMSEAKVLPQLSKSQLLALKQVLPAPTKSRPPPPPPPPPPQAKKEAIPRHVQRANELERKKQLVELKQEASQAVCDIAAFETKLRSLDAPPPKTSRRGLWYRQAPT